MRSRQVLSFVALMIASSYVTADIQEEAEDSAADIISASELTSLLDGKANDDSVRRKRSLQTPKQIIKDAWEKAVKLETNDTLQKNHYFNIVHMDKVFRKVDSCEACMAVEHRSINQEEADEQKSEKYLAARSIVGDRVNFGIKANKRLWKKEAEDRGVCSKSKIKQQPCEKKAKYRSINGTCNNLKSREFGQAGIAQRRFYPAAFDDGIQKPRQTAASGAALPSARVISNNLSVQGKKDTNDDSENTVALTAWGQFIDHDITLTPAPSGESGSIITCCGINKPFGERRQCFTIDIPADDQRFKGLTDCMEFKRSIPTVTDKCSPNGVREVRNDITAFLDASNVYGSSEKEAKDLRNGAKMKVDVSTGIHHLPPAPDTDCNITHAGDTCKKAGDVRVNEVSHLTMFHTCFVRLHNQIIDKLRFINGHWKNETLYQEARKIVGALMQHITYTEFLPIVLDESIIEKYALGENDAYCYNKTLDPGIRTEFSTAGFRFGHSMVQTNQASMEKNFRKFIENKPLRTQFFNPHISQNSVDGVARWTATRPCKRMDSDFVTDVKDFLFFDKKGMSLDLVALNIQRGRDHGLPPYTVVRCAVRKDSCPKTFNDLKPIMGNRNVNRLRKAYSNVEDIDLFVGGVSELPHGTGLVGETFGSIIGSQFHLLKYGDRFWYETTEKAVMFTPDQIKAIKKAKLSDILCDCFDLDKLQSNVFKKHSGGKTKAMHVLLNVAIVFVAVTTVTNDASVVERSTSCDHHICKASCNINNELKSTRPENIIEYVWCKAGLAVKEMKLQNKKCASEKVDQKYTKANTCLACMATMHQAESKDNEEMVSEKYLKALSLFRSVAPQLVNDQRVMVQWKLVARREGVCECLINEKCPHSNYRSIDGSCNNLLHPKWGQIMTAQRRFSYAAFDDGVSSPRQTGSDGKPLPSVREVSNKMNEGQGGSDTTDDKKLTVMVPAFGQLLDHDVTLTPEAEGEDGAALKCCGVGKRPQCFPITIPKKDPRFTQDCMEFKRSRPLVPNKCTTKGVRQQINAITAYIDASNVYDSEPAKAKNLRDKNGHGAKLRETPPDRLLPKGPDNSCNVKRSCGFCKLGGDVRANEVSTLTVLHTCFVRQHNNIVDVLKSLNSGWSQEKLYQETRRIVGAVMQRITYTQFLDAILDSKVMQQFRINEGAAYKYDPTVDASIRTEFSTAAFRFGHSMVQSNQACVAKDFKTFIMNLPLQDQFFEPFLPQVCPAGVALWASSSLCKEMDSGFVTAIRNFLFLDKLGNSLDLLSLNMQRGRDHGIPSYNEVRKAIGLGSITSFSQLHSIMSKKNVQRLQSVYSNVRDIDLFAGGVSENPVGNGVLGETFQRLIAKQFEALKFGDRFWYETSASGIAFSAAQLAVIKRVTLSDVLCDCFNLEKLQTNVFLKVSSSNPRQQCRKWANKHNLKSWKA